LSVAESIVWRRLDEPGHDFARLVSTADGVTIHGVSVVAYDGTPSAVRFEIRCDRAWRTRAVEIDGWIGVDAVRSAIATDGAGEWVQEGEPVESVRGCLDIDLAFSPFTNLLPIRRLGLRVGEEAAVRAAWVPFPELALQPLDQRYRRLSEGRYRYESDGGRFVRELEVSPTGFVTRYPGLWEAEVRSAG
jgi:hypothetical protein